MTATPRREGHREDHVDLALGQRGRGLGRLHVDEGRASARAARRARLRRRRSIPACLPASVPPNGGYDEIDADLAGCLASLIAGGATLGSSLDDGAALQPAVPSRQAASSVHETTNRAVARERSVILPAPLGDRGRSRPADLVFGPTLAYRGFRLMLSHYRPSRPRPRYAAYIGRYDLPLRRAMLARRTNPPAYVDPFGRVYHGLRRSRARNHRPGRERGRF